MRSATNVYRTQHQSCETRYSSTIRLGKSCRQCCPRNGSLCSSFAGPLHQIQKCLQTHLKTVRHGGQASFAKGLFEPGKGPRRELRPGELQIDLRVAPRFAKGISEDEVINDCKQRELFSGGHGCPSKRL